MWKLKFLCSENVSLTISSLFGRGGMRLIFSALLASVLVAPVAHAQQPNDDENELEEIVVTATRIPTPLADTLPTTAIITAEDIERIKPQDFGELLKLKSGIGFRDSGGRGSSGGLFVRGTRTEQTLILIDGIRVSSATNGATAIQRIPLEAIERIEIIKGPMSGVYGADAIGGVIQIFTKQFLQEGATGVVNVTAGSNHLRQYSTRAAYGEENYSVSASLSTESTDGINRTTFTEGENADRDSFKQNSGSFSLASNPTDELAIELNHVQSSSKTEYDNTRPSHGKNWYSLGKLATTALHIENEHSENIRLSGTFGTTKDYLKSNNPGGFGHGNNFETTKTDYSIQADLIFSAQNQVSVGVDYQKDKVESNNVPYGESDRTNKGIFLLWQYQGDRSSSAVSMRNDRNSAYSSNSNYSLQQSFDISNQYKIIASYGTAFRAPTFNQLYWPGFGTPDLKPEKSKSLELSLRANLDEVSWQINAYHTKIKDFISPSDESVSNIDSSTLKGIEIELSRQWDDYNFDANLDYLDAQDDKTGMFLSDRARAAASIELGKQTDNLYVGVDAFIEHSRFDSIGFGESAKLLRLPGYALWGITANYQFSDKLSISGRIDNLFDKEYVTNLINEQHSYRNEGRTIEMSLEYRF